MAFLQNPNEETQADSDKERSMGYKGYIDFGDYIAYHSKQFFDELLTPVIKKQFDLRYDGSHTWYGPWENHMRKVITMFFLKGDSAIMEWGYNFDFLPIVKSNRIVYYRTEKSIQAQLRTFPKAFIDMAGMAEWKKYKIPMHVRNKEQLEQNIQEVWKITVPQITDWFLHVDSLETAIHEAEYQVEYGKYYRLFSPGQLYVKAFLQAQIGNIEQAENLLKETWMYNNASAVIQDKLLKKLRSLFALEDV